MKIDISKDKNQDDYDFNELKLYIGGKNTLSSDDGKQKIVTLKKRFQDILQIPNLSFLIGSGCSNYLGVQTFNGLATQVEDKLKSNVAYVATSKIFLKSKSTKIVGTEIEKYLGFLFNIKATATNSQGEEAEKIVVGTDEISLRDLNELIIKLKEIIVNNCNNLDTTKLNHHKQFIKKILQRDSNQSLPRNRIFTTNYDLAFEYALDQLGVHYFNGFTGNIRRFFSPDNFEVDLHYRKASKGSVSRYSQVVDLVKLHGSINWLADNSIDVNNLYGIQETQNPTLADSKQALVYPTPLKVGNSLNTPYADLFRVLHSSVVQPDSALIVNGYSFSDEHINDIISQALTIPSFKLIIVGNQNLNINGRYFNEDAGDTYLEDPRIWHLCDLNDSGKLTYFEKFVTEVLPNIEEENFQEKITETLIKIKNNEDAKSK